ncbi:hypothetical protein SDC9_156571 [bioreactor metagenome]|uniref:Uncharacterized protein n=1 Tax=bioreactor metagenome TaxID=1076179 RepID=A0A645F6X7_9ZZZZ
MEYAAGRSRKKGDGAASGAYREAAARRIRLHEPYGADEGTFSLALRLRRI